MPKPSTPSRLASPGDTIVFRGLALVGGHPALDFLNTVKYRGAVEPNDTLTSFSAVVEWARRARLLSEAEAERLSRRPEDAANAARVHRRIIAFRERARALFDGPSQRGAGYVRAVSRVEAAISALRPVAMINRESGVLTRHIAVNTPADVKARIVAAVAELLSERATLRIKTCDGGDCDWLFIDRTKAGRRRWCDTRTCGNIARVRRHRLKRDAGP